MWWPCVIQKFAPVQKNSGQNGSGVNSSSKYQVIVQYYDRGRFSANFKLEPSKVELFFRSEEHFNFKVRWIFFF